MDATVLWNSVAVVADANEDMIQFEMTYLHQPFDGNDEDGEELYVEVVDNHHIPNSATSSGNPTRLEGC